MTPPPATTFEEARQRSGAVDDDLSRIRWAGWAIVSVLVLSWAGWISLLAITNSRQVTVLETQQEIEFRQIDKSLQEIKTDVKELLRK